MKVQELFEATALAPASLADFSFTVDTSDNEEDADDANGKGFSFIIVKRLNKSPPVKAALKLFAETIRRGSSRDEKNQKVHYVYQNSDISEIDVTFGSPAPKALTYLKKQMKAVCDELAEKTNAKNKRAADRAANPPAPKGPPAPGSTEERNAKLKEKYGAAILKRVTSRKSNGDDAYSHAIFIDNREYVGGLTQREIPYYKEQAYKKLSGKHD